MSGENDVINLAIVLKNRIGLEEIKVESIHLVLKEAMELVDGLNISGSEKKENVKNIVKILVNDLVKNEKEKELLIEIINNNILENTIDLIVKASKNEININNRETQKRLIQCFSFSLRILARLITMCRIKKNKNK
tara:strand:+ start:794 stop:1201 length:408 start_codon:yes stop_codon:yes gene_type:complete